MPIAESPFAALRHHAASLLHMTMHPAAAAELRRTETAYSHVVPFDADAHHLRTANPWRRPHQALAIGLLANHLGSRPNSAPPHLLVVSLVPDQITQHLLSCSYEVSVLYPTLAAARSRAPYLTDRHRPIVGSALAPAFHRLQGPWDAVLVVDVLNHLPTVATDRLARHFVRRLAGLAPGRPIYMTAIAWADDIRYRAHAPRASGDTPPPTYHRSRQQIERLLRRADMQPLYLNTDVGRPDHHRHHLVALAPGRPLSRERPHPHGR